MTYKPKSGAGNSDKICEQSVETLQEYKRKGIPLMPHQEAFLANYYDKFKSPYQN